jgi:hypothetical protein
MLGDLFDIVKKGCDSSVYDFGNDVDTEIRSQNVIRWLINAPAKGDMVAQFWGDWFGFFSASYGTRFPFHEVAYTVEQDHALALIV